MKEIWKDIVGFIGLYMISNWGRIKSLGRFHNISHKWIQREKFLRPQKNSGKYLYVDLWNNNAHKKYLIHHLVLQAFVGPCPLGMERCHIDGNSENNKLDNLYFGTHQENMNDLKNHPNAIKLSHKNNKFSAKLNNWKLRIIRRLLEDEYLTQKEIAEIFEVTQPSISLINKGKIWVNNV